MRAKPPFATYFILKPKCKRDRAWRCYSRWMQKQCNVWWNAKKAENTLKHFGITLEDLGCDPKDIVVGTL
jgi:hypothetical protein